MTLPLFAAALWGVAEATLFFIVPDVILSFIALRRGWRAGALAALAASIGAAVGGLVMYRWGAADIAAATAMLERIPAIDGAMIEAAAASLRDGGALALLQGALTGVPYKIFAVAAGADQRQLLEFLALTPLVRLPRFLAIVAIVEVLRRTALHHLLPATRLMLLAGFWIVFYAGFFAVMP